MDGRTSHIVSLRSAEEALSLPKGRLASPAFSGLVAEIDFSPEQVFLAAQVLIEHNDGAELFSQAGVIARAGKYGWGMGNVYRSW